MSQELNKHTLTDLITATGFTRRQIRFYITQGLVPGANERGPNATYGDESLRRLQLISKLKTMEVGPAGRSLTLEEIGSVLDTLGEDGAENLVACGAQLTILDTDEGQATPLGSAADYMNSIRRSEIPLSLPKPEFLASDHCVREETGYALFDHVTSAKSQIGGGLRSKPDHVHLGPLTPLLRQLHRVLADLTSDSQIQESGRDESWRRIRTPDIEIQVRVPDSERRRARLEEVARALSRLLDGEA
jgi:DNA-binding transcriptional MerR regulator